MDLGADHDAGTGVNLDPGPDEPPMRVDISSIITSYRASDGTYYHLHREFVDINKEGKDPILMCQHCTINAPSLLSIELKPTTLCWHQGSCCYLGDVIAAAPLNWRRLWRGLVQLPL